MDENAAKPTKGKKEAAGPERKSVMLEPGSHCILERAAKKLKLSNGEYASAAIAYFAERGLNPTVEPPQGLADIRKVVIQEARATRVQEVDIANRLISIIRTWEKSNYGFMQQQQAGVLNYLEQIESNLLRHQIALETNFLSPMVEMMLKNNIETYIARVLLERFGLHVTGKSESEWSAANKAMNADRDQQLVSQMREFIKTNSRPAPKLAPKPQLAAAPAKAPVAPAAAPPAGGSPPK